MHWMMIGFLAFAWLMPLNSARACSCMQQSPEEAIASADAIFEGTVTAISDNAATDFGGLEVAMTINRAWKGVSGEKVSVITASNSAACGYAFRVGTTYLVYAYRAKTDRLRVSLCSLTKTLDQAKPDLKLLGAPRAPAVEKAAATTKDDGRCSASAPGGGGSPLLPAAFWIGVWVFATRRFRGATGRQPAR